MKRLSILASIAAILAFVPSAHAKTYSQKTFTQFADGHWESKVCYTDGSCDDLEQGWLEDDEHRHRHPHSGDLKHREEVWEDDHWVIRVEQWY